MVKMRPQYLDPKVKWVWLLPTLLFILLIWFIASTVALFAVEDESIVGLQKPIFIVVLLISLLILIAGPVLAFYHLEYISFTYVCAENEFVIRQGVITRHTTVIPYHRIQNINTNRTLIDRLFGLANLEIETAGSRPEGELPGVSNKDKLVKQIMSNVEESKRHKKNTDGLPSERELLAEILKELSRTNHNLSQMLRTGHNLEGKRPQLDNKVNWSSMAPSNSRVIKKDKK